MLAAIHCSLPEGAMKTIVVAVGVGLSVVAATSRSITAQQTDAATVLAAARQALGGEALLSGITALKLDGLWWPNPGAGCYGPRQVIFDAPERFVERNAQPEEGSDGFECPDRPLSTFRRGFVGDVAIHEGAGAPNLLDQQHRSVRYLLPLFASSFASYPLDFTYAGREKIAGRTCDVIAARGPDDFEFRLFVDLKTHLPAMLTWMEASRVVGVNHATGLLVVTVDPTLVEYQMSIGDYKRSNGLNWPRRFRTRVHRHVVDEFFHARFTINPAIDPNAFTITRDIVVRLSTGATNAWGRIAVPTRPSLPEYTVIVFPADRSLWIPGSHLVVATKPDADHLCEFPNLRVGKYRVAVVTDAPPNPIDAAYLDTLMPASLAFAIRYGQQMFQLRIGG